jgi:hypothetical protein
MRKIRTIALAAVLSLMWIPATASPALASCVPNRTDDGVYYLVGRDQTVAATQIKSTIYQYQPYVYSGFSWSWVMLGGNGNFMWAQIGPVQYTNSRYTAVQYSWPSEWHTVTFPAYSLGTTVPYQVTYIPSTKYFFFFASNLAPGYHKFSVYIPQWVPSGGRISGEIPTRSNQMMGAYSYHETFTGNKIYYSGSWHDYTGGLQSYNQTYFGASGNAIAFDIWDKYCTV